jgi:hypothetical protein
VWEDDDADRAAMEMEDITYEYAGPAVGSGFDR